jgi:transposase
MPRFKPIDRGMKLLPIDLSVQLLPGTFEHALSHLIDHELDLRGFDEHFHNDESGAPAYASSVMLKAILYA